MLLMSWEVIWLYLQFYIVTSEDTRLRRVMLGWLSSRVVLSTFIHVHIIRDERNVILKFQTRMSHVSQTKFSAT